MSGRTIEAILKISTKMGSMNALKTLQREIGKVESQAKAFNHSQAVMTRGLQATWLQASRFIGPLALGYAATDMVRSGAKIEEAMFNIKKKSGASAEQIAVLKKEIMDLGQEVPVSLEEIASAFERGAAAGIPLAELREFAKLTVQVSDAWDMSAEATANAFSGFGTGLGVARKDLEGLADLINYLADSGIADESQIVDFLDRAGASLKNFGLSPEESAAVGATMANLKMAPEIAARAMDTLTGKLMAPENLSKKSRTALTEIVGDLKEFAQLVQSDASGALVTFFEKLQEMPAQKRVSLLGALMGEGFDDEMARAAAGLAELKRNLDAVLNPAAYDGSIGGLSVQRLELFNSKMKMLGNQATELKEKLFELSAKGGGFLDATSGVVGAVNDKIDYDKAIDAALRKEGMTQAEIDTWRARNVFNRAARDSKAVDGGYKLGDQVLPELAMPTVGPTFFEDVAVPMKRPSNEASSSQLPSIAYPGTAPYVPLSDADRRGVDAGGDQNRADFLAAAAGESLKQGGDEAGQAVAEGGQQAARSLIDAAAIFKSAVGTMQSVMGSLRAMNNGSVNADTGRSGVETEARNFVP